MSLLVKENLEVVQSDTVYKHLEWHHRLDWLAVSSYNIKKGGEVNFFQKNNKKSVCFPLQKRDSKVSTLNWHPIRCFIAVGWENGEVTLKDVSNDKEKTVKISEGPQNQITCSSWDPTGLQLCLVTKAGKICIKEFNQDQTIINEYNAEISEHLICTCYLGRNDDLQTNEKAKGIPLQSAFLIGGSSGGLYKFSSHENWTKAFQVEKSIVKVLVVDYDKTVLCISEDLIFRQLMMNDRGQFEEKRNLKFTGKELSVEVAEISSDTLAVGSHGKEIRIWNLRTDDIDILTLCASKGFSPDDTISSLSYSQKKSLLSAGTLNGKLAIWNKTNSADDKDSSRGWKLRKAYSIGNKITQVSSSPTTGSLAVCCETFISILLEQPVLSQMKKNTAIVQLDSRTFLLIHVRNHETTQIAVQFAAKGLFAGEENVVVWDDEQVLVYEIVNNGKFISTKVIANFSCSVTAAAVYKQNIICAEKEKISLRTFQGTIKQNLLLPENEGLPQMIDVELAWLCVATTNGFLRIYEVNAEEETQRYHPKCMSDFVEDFKSFISIKANCEGTRVCFTYTVTKNQIAKPSIVVWDAETDAVFYFDFLTGLTDQQLFEMESFPAEKRPMTAAFKKIEREKAKFLLPEHIPGFCCWDVEDPRFLVCEADSTNQTTSYIVSMFVTSENGIQMHDIQEKSSRAENLIGVNVPHIYSVKKTDNDEADVADEKCYARYLLEGTLKDFSGLEASEKFTKTAMLNFSFYLAIGRMDEAFKEIKFIKSEKVWEHMARMCVKTRRLDVAFICLGNMGHAQSAKAVRNVVECGETPEIQIAFLAIQLGLYEEAKAIFKKCSRYDLLNKFYRSKNDWKEALEIAHQHDRIHLRNTYYLCAEYFKAKGNIEEAIKHYEKSFTHYEEVPHLLIENPKQLEAYVKKKQEPRLEKWWAQYLESVGDSETALHHYRQASDHLSIVRLLCYDNKIDEAKKAAESSGDKAACYHLARYFENASDPKNAVHFFAKAHAYNSAIRLAKEYNMTDQLANLALVAGESDRLEAAKYYENIPGQTDKAVMLYHKIGMLGKAMDIAFATQQFTALDLIAKNLDENSDPRMLEKAANFYAKTQQFHRAVELLAYSKNYVGAVEFCKQNNVPLTEQMVELLTPPKASISDPAEWRKMVEGIAECCVTQGKYYAAAKKYTQAGNKIQAMRCLLKTGNTDKIIFFANTARNPEIYILAANYLQTLDWKNDENILKHIVMLYTKSNAYEHLTGFYEACAVTEIDDYRNYEKACEALNEAQRYLQKASDGEPKNMMQLMERQEKLKNAVQEIKQFIAIRNIYDEDPLDAVRRVEAMINNKQRGEYIRVGDLYAILIVHNVRSDNYRKAYSLIKQLCQQEPDVDIKRYINVQLLDKICDETGNPRLTTDTDANSDDDELPEPSVDYSHALIRRQKNPDFDPDD